MSAAMTLRKATDTRCQHVYKNRHRCIQQGNECWHEGWRPNQPADAYYCERHMHRHGFCVACGMCHAGEEEFEFSPLQMCEDCEEMCRAEMGEDEDEEDGAFDDDY